MNMFDYDDFDESMYIEEIEDRMDGDHCCPRCAGFGCGHCLMLER